MRFGRRQESCRQGRSCSLIFSRRVLRMSVSLNSARNRAQRKILLKKLLDLQISLRCWGENQKRIALFNSAAPSVHACPRSVRPGRRATYRRRFRAQPCSKAIRASLLSHRDRDGRQRGWDGPRPVPQHRDGSSRHKATHEETDQQIQGSLQSAAINRH